MQTPSFFLRARPTGWHLLLAGVTLLGGCSSFNATSTRMAGVITPYKVDVVQGNFVAREQIAALKPGMNRIQVREIMGTPLLASVFHLDRWDYVFTMRRQGTEPQARRVAVFFKGNVMERVQADELPTETEFLASLDSGRKRGEAPNLQASEEALSKYPPPPPATTSNKNLPPLPSSYPPLEAAGSVGR